MPRRSFAATSAAALGPAQAWQARPYSQLLRGPTYRWWRPWWSAVLVCAWFVVLVVGLAVGLGIAAATGAVDLTRASSLTDEQLNAWMISPAGLAWTNLTLASLIPGAQLAVWGGYGWSPRWVASVRGGLRWGWLIRCVAVSAVIVGGLTVAAVAVTGGMDVDPGQDAVLIGVVVLATTPLQAAGEEYLFRGWLTQAIGAAIPRALVGAVCAAVVSGLAFAALHGQQDAWLFSDRLGFGLIASWLVWRTGGLEAPIAMHAVNNLLAFAMTLLSGELEQALTSTTASPVSAVFDLVTLALAASVIDRIARRRGIARRFTPPVRAA